MAGNVIGYLNKENRSDRLTGRNMKGTDLLIYSMTINGHTVQYICQKLNISLFTWYRNKHFQKIRNEGLDEFYKRIADRLKQTI